jgi:hypothetical protein
VLLVSYRILYHIYVDGGECLISCCGVRGDAVDGAVGWVVALQREGLCK